MQSNCCRFLSTADENWTDPLTHPSQMTKAIPPARKIALLKHRILIEVSGKGSTGLLQHMVTQDITKMNDERPVVYAVVLGKWKYGNVLHDVLIYKCEDRYFVECDDVTKGRSKMLNLIELFEQCALQKELDVTINESSKQVCCVFQPGLTIRDHAFCNHASLVNKLSDVLNEEEDNAYPDPRCSQLGARVITNDASELLSRVDPLYYEVGVGLDAYRRHRYMLGVAEGFTEMGYGRGSATEYNVDYLGGLDDKKEVGYEGWEYVKERRDPRKRILPLWLENKAGGYTSSRLHGADIFHQSRVVGKLINYSYAPRKQLMSVRVRKKHVVENVDVLVGLSCMDYRKHIVGSDALSFDTSELYMLPDPRKEDEKIRIASFTPDWWPLWYVIATHRYA